MNWSDIYERAAWTALQGFLGTLTAVSITDVDRELLISAAAAAVAALLSFFKTVAQERIEQLDTRAR